MGSNKGTLKLTKSKKELLSRLLDKHKVSDSESKAQKPSKRKANDRPNLCTTTKRSKLEKNEILSQPGKRKDDDGGEQYTNSKLLNKMKNKLTGARFRWINEKLYTSSGDSAFELMKDNPKLFDEYHEGFALQVKSWPVNPVDTIIKLIQRQNKDTVIADLGCGEAKIAQTLSESYTIHSFDLVSPNKNVVACDISKLPLKDKTVNMAVFCLALMGINWLEFIDEANRILKNKGQLVIAEVVSRLLNVDEFVSVLESRGFNLKLKKDYNKMFVLFIFQKKSDIPKSSLSKAEKNRISALLKPCLYKKR